MLFKQIKKLAKFSITIFSATIISYTTEIFPTKIRTIAFGLTISFGKFGIFSYKNLIKS